MKKFLFLFVAALTVFTSCVDDDDYVPPTGEDFDVVLNEIQSKDPVTEFDWIELYNKGEAEVDISGYLLNDGADPAGGFVIPDGTKIAAKGYYVVTEDDVINLGISSNGEDASFGKPDGTLIEVVTVPASQQDGTTYGRETDGADTWVEGMIATKGTANGASVTIPVIGVSYDEYPAPASEVNVEVTFSESDVAVSSISVYYSTGDAPAFDAANKLDATDVSTSPATIAMKAAGGADLSVDGEKVSFFVVVTLEDATEMYIDNEENTVTDVDVFKADPTRWDSYTAIDVAPPTLDVIFSATPTIGYEAIALEYTASIAITEARIYFAYGDTPEYIKGNKVKGEDDASFTQTGVTIAMDSIDVEDADGTVIATTSDGGKVSFYVRIALDNGNEYYYGSDGVAILDDGVNSAAADAFKDDPSLWNNYTPKTPATVSSFTFPETPAATDDINVVLAYACGEEILEARIYFAGSEGLYVKANKFKGEDDASFTQTGVTINMRDEDVEKVDETLDGTTSTSGATIKFYFRISTATSEYYFGKDGVMLAVDDTPADGATDTSDAFKDDSSQWQSYTVQ